MNHIKSISRANIAQYDPEAWLSEGNGLLESAKFIRSLWQSNRESFNTKLTRNGIGNIGTGNWSKHNGLPRASMLLLGYAVEMFLKAGLAKAYRGCSQTMFDRDVKGKYGHKLCSLANVITFPFEVDDKVNFDSLKHMILIDARYPIPAEEGTPHHQVINQQTARIWSEKKFESFIELANRVRDHVNLIDKNESDPSECEAYHIHTDGYLAYRLGGNLPPRITYKISTEQKENGETLLEDMKRLFASSEDYRSLNNIWNDAFIFEDGEHKVIGKTKTIKEPDS